MVSGKQSAGKRIVVLISADAEWRAALEIFRPANTYFTKMGETFDLRPFTYFHGGWGKISAAATAQYVIDRYQPDLLVNLGTCGGFAGRIERGTIILVTKTIVYDILEQMSDPDEAIEAYTVELDLSWLAGSEPGTAGGAANNPPSFIRGPLVSADRDLVPADIPRLMKKYGAVAADWESGAIAWVAKKNGVRGLILRGVTDLIGPSGGEAYGNLDLFHENTKTVMKKLIAQVPGWLAKIS